MSTLKKILISAQLFALFLNAQAFPSVANKANCPVSLSVDDPTVIDLATYPGCIIPITTKGNRIMAFQNVDGVMNDLFGIIKIQDIAASVTMDKPNALNDSKIDPIKTVYSSSYAVVLTISESVPADARLSVQKAVACPANLGTETQCARVFGDLACYCAVFTQRNWYDQKSFCTQNGFSLLSIETKEEDDAIFAYWGTTAWFWISLNDIDSEGSWKWDSTGIYLYPGYTNWASGEPSNTLNEDCGQINYDPGLWNDNTCSKSMDAICELQP